MAVSIPRWSWRHIHNGLLRRADRVLGENIQWARVVMDRTTEQYVCSLPYQSMKVLEVSGDKWKNFGFAKYESIDYPKYDICDRPLDKEAFDLVIAEQVFEHILWPYRAVRNVYEMLKPGGVFLVTTPFLLRIHNCPIDCSRWTPLGLKHLLAEGGFVLEDISADSWGNRACVRSNFARWTPWVPWCHSLENDRDFPVVVWAMATKRDSLAKKA